MVVQWSLEVNHHERWFLLDDKSLLQKMSRKRNPGSIRYILGGVIGLAPFDFLKRPATKYDV